MKREKERKIPWKKIVGGAALLVFILFMFGFFTPRFSPIREVSSKISAFTFMVAGERSERWLRVDGGALECDMRGCFGHMLNEGKLCYEDNEWECIDADSDGCPGTVTMIDCDYGCNKETGVCYPEHCGNTICDNYLVEDLGEDCSNCPEDCGCEEIPGGYPAECHQVRNPEIFASPEIEAGDWVCVVINSTCGNNVCEEEEHSIGELPCPQDCGPTFN